MNSSIFPTLKKFIKLAVPWPIYMTAWCISRCTSQFTEWRKCHLPVMTSADLNIDPKLFVRSTGTICSEDLDCCYVSCLTDNVMTFTLMPKQSLGSNFAILSIGLTVSFCSAVRFLIHFGHF